MGRKVAKKGQNSNGASQRKPEEMNEFGRRIAKLIDQAKPKKPLSFDDINRLLAERRGGIVR